MQIQYFDYNSGSQPYKYNGKEFINDNNLHSLSYSFRMQDPQLGRWHCPDALGEIYSSTSPYAYCGNDPVNYTDFAGLTRTYNYTTGKWEGTRGQDLGYFTGGLGSSSGGAGSSPVPIGGAGLQEAGPKPTNKQLDDYIAACNNPYAPFKGSLSDYIALTNSPASLGGVTYNDDYTKTLAVLGMNRLIDLTVDQKTGLLSLGVWDRHPGLIQLDALSRNDSPFPIKNYSGLKDAFYYIHHKGSTNTKKMNELFDFIGTGRVRVNFSNGVVFDYFEDNLGLPQNLKFFSQQMVNF